MFNSCIEIGLFCQSTNEMLTYMLTYLLGASVPPEDAKLGES